MSTWRSSRLAGVLLATLSAGIPADEASHRQAVERLFELTDMQEKIEESVDNVLALQLAQSPPLREHEAVVREFLERHIGWQSLEKALTDMYMQAFTEQEVIEMNAFYSSTTGEKVIERLPVLVQQRNQLASQRLQENIGELRQELDARLKRNQQADEP
ncbi:MAG: DUF2059 domain-containing protein [Gammaproteobacteria bacterium]